MRVLMLPGRVSSNDNPFISILTAALRSEGVAIDHFSSRAVSGSYNAFHVHWLESVFWGRLSKRFDFAAERRSKAMVTQAQSMRARGGRVVWTVHNLNPHEAYPPRRLAVWNGLRRDFLPLVTDAIVMGEGTGDLIRSAYPEIAGARLHEIPHPSYKAFFESHSSTASPSRKDGEPRFSCVGKLRRYKGVSELVRELRLSEREFSMVIAGDGPADYIAEIRAEIGSDRRFELLEAKLSHGEVVSVFRDSDAAIFNFRDILNSGSVLAALSTGTPVICPDLPTLKNLARMVGSDWMQTFTLPLTADWMIDRAASFAALHRGTVTYPSLAALDPKIIASSHMAVYEGGPK